MRLARIVFIAAVGVLLFLICLPGKKVHRDSAMMRFARIYNAISLFAQDHQSELPSRLSDLVPRYVPLTNLGIFYPLELRTASSELLSQDAERARTRIDVISDCVYLGAAGVPREILAYERDGPWRHDFGARRLVITLGGGAITITASELDDLMRKDQSDVLERLRNTRASYFAANLHASLNSYHIDHGAYPIGGNASVVRSLFGETQSYTRMRNAQGEELDPWGTPYIIESDGKKVRIKSAGSNRSFDQIGNTNYDDICLSVINGSVIGDDTLF